MPSLHKRNGSPYWYAAFYYPDGRRGFRSTGHTNKQKAWAVCNEYCAASDQAKQGRFSEASARRTIAAIYAQGAQQHLEFVSAQDYLNNWLDAKSLELAESSFVEYTKIVTDFLTSLGGRKGVSIDMISAKDIARFRSDLATRVRAATANKYLRCLRGAWNDAHKQGLLRDNEFTKIELLRESRKEQAQRRAFTLPELKRILEKCSDDWRGLVLMGLYTGQRLSDILNLTWQNVDLQNATICFVTAKTGRAMDIPIAPPLLKYLMSLPSVDNPKAPLFPALGQFKQQTISRQFADILRDAGLLSGETKAEHIKTRAGRDKRRNTNEVSFHCLRHTATSLLKNAGVGEAIAMDIIGHQSTAISQNYTHIESDAKRQALAKLPDITVRAQKEA